MANENHSGKTLEEITPLFIGHCQLSSEQVHQTEISTRVDIKIIHGLNKDLAELLHLGSMK